MSLGSTETSGPAVGPYRPAAARPPLGDLLAVALLAAALPALLLLPLAWLRVPVALAAVLLAPGYALTAALFPGRADLDGVARGALSFGLSVALIPMLALALDYVGLGLRPVPMVIALGGATCGLCLAAAVGRYRSTDPYRPPALAPARLTGPRLAAAGAALAVALWAGAVYGGALGAREGATAFSALGAGGLAEDYPRAAVAGQPLSVGLGVTSHEAAAATYRVEARAGGATLATVGPITLAPGESWAGPLAFALPSAGDDQAVDLLLFREGDPAPYRSLRLWVNVAP